VALPLIDVAVDGDPAAIREFAQTAEEIDYQDMSAPDYVLGVSVASRPDWGDRDTSAGPERVPTQGRPGWLHSHSVAALSSDR
jgi:hypothetical protein